MNTDPIEKTYFREIQYYRQRWMLLVLMAAVGLSWYSFLNLILFKTPLTKNTIPDWMTVILWIIFGLFAPILLYITRLVTELDSEGLHIKFSPLSSQTTIPFTEIQSVNLGEEVPPENRSFLDIHIGGGDPPVYTISGSRVIGILLQNGDKILLGSQDPEGLAQAIKRRLM